MVLNIEGRSHPVGWVTGHGALLRCFRLSSVEKPARREGTYLQWTRAHREVSMRCNRGPVVKTIRSR